MTYDILKSKVKKGIQCQHQSLRFSGAPANAPNSKMDTMIGIVFHLNVPNVHLCNQLHYLFKVQKIRYLTINFKLPKFRYVKTGKDNNEIIKISEKTEKVLKNSSSEKLYHSLVSLKCTYLKHKYLVYNDKQHWPKTLRTTEEFGAICHLDYSENLTQSYKYDPGHHILTKPSVSSIVLLNIVVIRHFLIFTI